MKKMTGRFAKHIAGVVCAAAVVSSMGMGAFASDAWPTGDVSIYVPAGAGGSSDTIVRQYVERMKDITGANFIVVNDTTGGNSVAYETVRNAKTDGLTLMAYHGGMNIQYAAGQYPHSMDEFTVIDSITSSDTYGAGIWVNGNSEFETFEDLLDYARENPGDLVVGVETNNADHLLAVMMQDRFDVEFSIVSAGSNSEKLPLLLGNNLDVCFFAPAGMCDYHTSGELKCLAFFGSENFPEIPEVPSMKDLGYEPMVLPLFFFIIGPKDMPEDVCGAIDAVVQEIHADEGIHEFLNTLGLTWEYLTPEEAKEAVYEMQQSYVDAYALLNEQQ